MSTNSRARPVLPSGLTSDRTLFDGDHNNTTYNNDRRKWNFYLLHIIGIVVMIIWPWIFLAAAMATEGGLAMHPMVGSIVNKNPNDTTWVVTNISNILAIIVTYFFSSSARTLASKWLTTESRRSDIWTLSFMSAAKSPSQSLSWLFSNKSWLLASYASRLRPASAVLLYFVLFLVVLSGFNALLTPHTITRTAKLTGSELDFTTTDSNCTFWLANNAPADDCNWLTYGGSSFTTCQGENQMVDVLESGRSNILSSVADSNNTVTFNQLGGIRFSGPVRGVLPIGPDGIAVLDSLSPSPLTDGTIKTALSYEYALSLQGLASNVSCIYDTETPIAFVSSATYPGVQGVSGTCPPGQDVLLGAQYPSFLGTSNNFLGFYACNSSSTNSGASYNLYFRGEGNYNGTIGNTTCQVSSAHHAVYDVQFVSQTGLFASRGSNSPPPNGNNKIVIDSAVRAMGELVWNAQWLEFNSVAESIITFGVKDFGVERYAKDEKNLRLLEDMIQGVLEYEVTYGRLLYALYNTGPDMANDGVTAPPYCLRSINGSVSYDVTGWHMSWHNPLYLIPMTIVNLTSLAMLIAAGLFVGDWKKLPSFDPADPISVLIAASRGEVNVGPRPIDDPDDIRVSHLRIRFDESNGVERLWTVDEEAQGSTTNVSGNNSGEEKGAPVVGKQDMEDKRVSAASGESQEVQTAPQV
ncbi:hypothetical protein JAAARDRAFT_39389 [Jaapia argillacea MUCL 33604]|uniref:Uncharacterized protein n=1 Tax=Jaapia argillacea MUCL 33604 TaxID=933084 RepID=A0A067PPV4_9AGAM|nr:hypothetical protein JAAARDRAFT_39389 [Jaapia argillacea MUCL 33604]